MSIRIIACTCDRAIEFLLVLAVREDQRRPDGVNHETALRKTVLGVN